jgi:histone H3/H4
VSLDLELSKTYMHRIIKKGAAERVNELTCKELARVLEEVGTEKEKDGLAFAMHDRRKRVKARDIRIVTKKVTNL